jgi:hypothetical protein
MKLPSPKTVVANAACLLVLLWLYGGDLLDGVRAQSADVSAFLTPPRVTWPVVVLVITLGVLGVVLWGLLRERPEGFKGYRLLPIVLVCALFVDLVLMESQVPLGAEDVALMSLSQFEQRAQSLVNGPTVPSNPAVLRPVLEQMGQPPYLVRGARAEAWSLQVRENCDGPVREAPGLEVGTFIYCVTPDRKLAWVTLVGLPVGERFGRPAVITEDGEPHVAIVQPVLPEQETAEGTPQGPFQRPPEPAFAPESRDAGGMAPAPDP